MNSPLKKIFDKVHSHDDRMIVPIGNLTIELQSFWTSKLDKKFKIEYRILEFSDIDFSKLEENNPYIKHIIEAIWEN